MQDLLEFAVAIAREAGELTTRHFRAADLAVEAKADASPVTVADREAEARLRDRIRARFPADAIVGEEGEDVPGTSGRTWFLDPIDGTKSFIHGVPLYTTLVACDDAEGPLVGVIAAPALGEATFAGRGLGCFHDDAPARVSAVARLQDAYVMTSGFEWWPPTLRLLADRAPFAMRTWGDGYGYSLVATGRVEAMLDPEAAPWDLAPLPVIIAEAGGRLTGLDGSPGVASGSALASNGLVHDELLAHFAGA